MPLESECYSRKVSAVDVISGIYNAMAAMSERIDALESDDQPEAESFREGYDVGYSEAIIDVAEQVEAGELIIREPPQEHTFTYYAVTGFPGATKRRGIFRGIAPTAQPEGFNLWVEETWNLRDGRHETPVLKAFCSTGIFNVEPV